MLEDGSFLRQNQSRASRRWILGIIRQLEILSDTILHLARPADQEAQTYTTEIIAERNGSGWRSQLFFLRTINPKFFTRKIRDARCGWRKPAQKDGSTVKFFTMS